MKYIPHLKGYITSTSPESVIYIPLPRKPCPIRSHRPANTWFIGNGICIFVIDNLGHLNYNYVRVTRAPCELGAVCCQQMN